MASWELRRLYNNCLFAFESAVVIGERFAFNCDKYDVTSTVLFVSSTCRDGAGSLHHARSNMSVLMTGLQQVKAKDNHWLWQYMQDQANTYGGESNTVVHIRIRSQ